MALKDRLRKAISRTRSGTTTPTTSTTSSFSSIRDTTPYTTASSPNIYGHRSSKSTSNSILRLSKTFTFRSHRHPHPTNSNFNATTSTPTKEGKAQEKARRKAIKQWIDPPLKYKCKVDKDHQRELDSFSWDSQRSRRRGSGATLESMISPETKTNNSSSHGNRNVPRGGLSEQSTGIVAGLVVMGS